MRPDRMFAIDRVRIQGYRCFEDITIDLEPDLTVLVGRNAAGKSNVLAALAAGLAAGGCVWPSESLWPKWSRDAYRPPLPKRKRTAQTRIEWRGEVDGKAAEWHIQLDAKVAKLDRRDPQEALERMAKREGWSPPVLAWYGADRIRRKARDEGTPPWDPRRDDRELLSWMKRNEQSTERVLKLVADALEYAAKAWKHKAVGPMLTMERSQRGRYEKAVHRVRWRELGSGEHAIAALVADIGRQVISAGQREEVPLGRNAQGIILIDEIEQGLGPRLERQMIGILRKAFPRMQLVVTTHSPQILSSIENQQLRWLAEGRVLDGLGKVEGRDSNSILRELMGTDDRDERGNKWLEELHDAIDGERWGEAKAKHQALEKRWGDLDPDLIRAGWFMDREERDANALAAGQGGREAGKQRAQ